MPVSSFRLPAALPELIKRQKEHEGRTRASGIHESAPNVSPARYSTASVVGRVIQVPETHLSTALWQRCGPVSVCDGSCSRFVPNMAPATPLLSSWVHAPLLRPGQQLPSCPLLLLRPPCLVCSHTRRQLHLHTMKTGSSTSLLGALHGLPLPSRQTPTEPAGILTPCILLLFSLPAQLFNPALQSSTRHVSRTARSFQRKSQSHHDLQAGDPHRAPYL